MEDLDRQQYDHSTRHKLTNTG